MSVHSFVPVILAGGSGTRLWPLSRAGYPKQFLGLTGDDSLLQQTLRRSSGASAVSPLLMCVEEHRFLTAEQVRDVGIREATILLEPAQRNTAPAIAAAAWQVLSTDNNAVMVVMPADHLIADQAAFLDTIDKAVALAHEGRMVTLGIQPVRPETGYGYIEATGEPTDAASGARMVSRFIEKPDAEKAEQLIASGSCYWNAGIFIFKAQVFLDTLEKVQPDIYNLTRSALEQGVHDLDFTRLDASLYSGCENISVDYAVMEKVDDLVVIPFDSGWSDIGSWDAVHQAMPQDSQGNAGFGHFIHYDSCNTYAHSESRLVVTLGTQNISVIETPDAVLVLDNHSAQSIKAVISHLAETHPELLQNHTTVYRPWGHYESLSLNERFQVKRISVKPGARLSLQKHFHRSEHWVVVSGTAIVTVDDQEIMLTENESTYIPLGAVHRLFNPGKIALEIIEVQSGAYLGEDDIVRMGDEYGRSS